MGNFLQLYLILLLPNIFILRCVFYLLQMMLTCHPDFKYLSKTMIAMTIWRNYTTHAIMKHVAFTVGNMSMALKMMTTFIHSAMNARRIQFQREELSNLHFCFFQKNMLPYLCGTHCIDYKKVIFFAFDGLN